MQPVSRQLVPRPQGRTGSRCRVPIPARLGRRRAARSRRGCLARDGPTQPPTRWPTTPPHPRRRPSPQLLRGHEGCRCHWKTAARPGCNRRAGNVAFRIPVRSQQPKDCACNSRAARHAASICAARGRARMVPSRRRPSATTSACAIVGYSLGRRLQSACAPNSRMPGGQPAMSGGAGRPAPSSFSSRPCCSGDPASRPHASHLIVVDQHPFRHRMRLARQRVTADISHGSSE